MHRVYVFAWVWCEYVLKFKYYSLCLKYCGIQKKKTMSFLILEVYIQLSRTADPQKLKRELEAEAGA